MGQNRTGTVCPYNIYSIKTKKAKYNIESGRKILKVLEKGEMSQMDELIERIKANDERIKKNLINKGKVAGRLEGILENMMNIIKNMLLQNEDEEKIMKYTNAKREDIEAAKKELGMC